MNNHPDMMPEHQPIERESQTSKAVYMPTDDERKAIKLLEKLYREARSEKDRYSKDWIKWYKMFRGKQWNEPRPSYRHTPVMNFIFSHIQNQAALITDSKPNFEFIGREPSDREFAEILTQIAEADWEGNNWFMDMTEVIYDAHLYGTGLSVMEYDPSAKMDQGSIVYESFDPLYLYPDPEARDFSKKCDYVVTAVPTPTSKVKEMAPEEKEEFIKPDLNSFVGFDKIEPKDEKLTNPQDNTIYYQDGSSSVKERDLTLLLTLYLKDNESMIEEEMEEECEDGSMETKLIQKLKYPGLRKVVVANKVLIYDGPCDYEDGEFPFQRFINFMNPRSFWGISEIEQLEGPQITFNKLVAFALDVLTLHGNPVWIVDDTSGIDPNALINRPGAVIPKTPGTVVQRLEGVQLQPWVQNMIDNMKGWFDELSGSHDVTQGAADRVSSAKAIIALQEAAYTRVRLKTKTLDSYLQDVGRAYRNRVMQYYTVPRVFRLTNNQNAQEYFKFHIDTLPDGRKVAVKTDLGYDEENKSGYLGKRQEYILSGELDTKVTTGTSLPFAKAEMKQEAIQLFQLGIIDAEEVLDRIDYPNKDKILDRMQKRAEEQAQAQAVPAQQQ